MFSLPRQSKYLREQIYVCCNIDINTVYLYVKVGHGTQRHVKFLYSMYLLKINLNINTHYEY